MKPPANKLIGEAYEHARKNNLAVLLLMVPGEGKEVSATFISRRFLEAATLEERKHLLGPAAEGLVLAVREGK